ncbi:MAG: hypothetical protein AB1522_02020 [Chloroflexota bacterium]
MDQPANTVSYFIAGYGVIFGVMIFYLASLIIRWRNLRQDEALLEELDQKESNTKE